MVRANPSRAAKVVRVPTGSHVKGKHEGWQPASWQPAPTKVRARLRRCL